MGNRSALEQLRGYFARRRDCCNRVEASAAVEELAAQFDFTDAAELKLRKDPIRVLEAGLVERDVTIRKTLGYLRVAFSESLSIHDGASSVIRARDILEESEMRKGAVK